MSGTAKYWLLANVLLYCVSCSVDETSTEDLSLESTADISSHDQESDALLCQQNLSTQYSCDPNKLAERYCCSCDQKLFSCDTQLWTLQPTEIFCRDSWDFTVPFCPWVHR